VSVVLSLDTGICDTQTKTFDEELAKHPNLAVITISMDLPFNQKRYCGGASIKATTLSDHKYGEFGKLYGILVKELRMHGRAVFVIGSDNKIAYAAYNKEIGAPVDFAAAAAAVNAAK
jgi:thiol peroxidase